MGEEVGGRLFPVEGEEDDARLHPLADPRLGADLSAPAADDDRPAVAQVGRGGIAWLTSAKPRGSRQSRPSLRRVMVPVW